jgi:hypothetical protein
MWDGTWKPGCSIEFRKKKDLKIPIASLPGGRPTATRAAAPGYFEAARRAPSAGRGKLSVAGGKRQIIAWAPTVTSISASSTCF